MEYAVTFGQRYRSEEHPRLPEAHPDGYVVIEAPDMDQAHAIAFDKIGGSWAFLCEMEDFSLDAWMHPLGELARYGDDGYSSGDGDGDGDGGGY